MNDDGFRLTPVDVRGQGFRRRALGYDTEGVEEFRQRVADELERLLRERAQMEDRMENFREQLRAFRDRERALNEAVVMAQQMREDTEKMAKRNSEVTIKEAHVKAEEIVADARRSEAEVRNDHVAAQRQFTGYVAAFRQLLLRQLAELDALAEHERDGSPPESS
jgi:DivIVA domain-containing protein